MADSAWEEPPAQQAQPAKVSLQADGDLQIWCVRGTLPDKFEWVLPILARPHKSETGRWYQVRKAGDYNAAQHVELSRVMDAHNHAPKDVCWWFTQSTLEKIATKHEGINRDFVKRWPGYEPPKVDPEDPDAQEIELEAEQGFSAQELRFWKKVHFVIGEHLSWDALKIIALAIRKEAIGWLAKDLKVLDLGFVRIMPMPVRANWKEALCVRFKHLLGAFRHARDVRNEQLTAMGFYHALASAKLLALDAHNWSKPRVRWTLELLPSQDLQRAMEEHEAAREDHLGPARYAAWILNKMSSRLGLSLEIMRHYTEQVRLPPAMVKEGSSFGSQILVPVRETGQIRPHVGLCKTLPLCPDEAFGRLSDDPGGKDELDQGPGPRTPDAPLELPEAMRTVKNFRALIGNGEIVDIAARNGP